MKQQFEASTDQEELILALFKRHDALLQKQFDNVMLKDFLEFLKDLDQNKDDEDSEGFTNSLMFKSRLDTWFSKNIDGAISTCFQKDKNLPIELEQINSRFVEEMKRLSVEKMRGKKQYSIDPMYVEMNSKQVLQRITEEPTIQWEDLIKNTLKTSSREHKLMANRLILKFQNIEIPISDPDKDTKPSSEEKTLTSIVPIRSKDKDADFNYGFLESGETKNFFFMDPQLNKNTLTKKTLLFDLIVAQLREIEGMPDCALALTSTSSLVLLSNISSKNDFIKTPLFNNVKFFGAYFSPEPMPENKKLVVIALIISPENPSKWKLCVRAIRINKNNRIFENKLGFSSENPAPVNSEVLKNTKNLDLKVFDVKGKHAFVFSLLGDLKQPSKLQLIYGQIDPTSLKIEVKAKHVEEWKGTRKLVQIIGQHIDNKHFLHLLLNTTSESEAVSNNYDHISFEFQTSEQGLDVQPRKTPTHHDLKEKKRQRTGPVVAFGVVSHGETFSIYYFTSAMYYYSCSFIAKDSHIVDQKHLSEYYKIACSVVRRDASADLLMMDRSCGDQVFHMKIRLDEKKEDLPRHNQTA